MLKHPPTYYAKKYKHNLMASAFEWAKASKAVRLQVGCVIYLNNHTISYGWNSMPSGSESEVCEITDGGLEPYLAWAAQLSKDGYEGDYKKYFQRLQTKPECLHAEFNSIEKIADKSLLVGAIVFVTHSCCFLCSQLLVDSKVSKVYYSIPYRCNSGLEHLRNNGIIVEQLRV